LKPVFATALAGLVVSLLAAAPALAHSEHAADVAQERPEGARGAILAQLAATEEKIVSLARAIPEDKFAWRPAEGVSSVEEALTHVAFSHYNLMRIAGTPMPPGITRDGLGLLRGKEASIGAILESFAHLRRAIEAMGEDDLAREAELFGRPVRVRDVLLKAVTHSAEHLGQLIAYGRMNGVTPPWSQKAAP
jgi:uncharacterized damage-inducible protein DinB